MKNSRANARKSDFTCKASPRIVHMNIPKSLCILYVHENFLAFAQKFAHFTKSRFDSLFVA